MSEGKNNVEGSKKQRLAVYNLPLHCCDVLPMGGSRGFLGLHPPPPKMVRVTVYNAVLLMCLAMLEHDLHS